MANEQQEQGQEPKQDVIFSMIGSGRRDELPEYLQGVSPEELNTPASIGMTVLCLACWYFHAGTVQLLLDAGADPTALGFCGKNALATVDAAVAAARANGEYTDEVASKAFLIRLSLQAARGRAVAE
jgi:hypothetical protein